MFCRLFLTILTLKLAWADDVTVNLNPKRSLHLISEQFISFAFDPQDFFEHFDFNSTKFNLVNQLSPALVRLTGPSTNKLRWVDNEELPCYDVTSSTHNPEYYLTQNKWSRLHEWARSTNVTPIFALNNLHKINGVWDPKEALAIMAMTDKMNYSCFWELGCECNDVVSYVQDVTSLQHILDAFPGSKDAWGIIGSDFSRCFNHSTTDSIKTFLTTVEDNLDAINWHAKDTNNELIFNERNAIIKALMPKVYLPVMMTIPSQQRHGTKKPTVTFRDALNWAAQLGDAAKYGFGVLFKQMKVDEIYHETPTYWVSMLHKTLMGRNVIDAKMIIGNRTHHNVYAHCTRNQNQYVRRGAVTVMAVNKHFDPVTITLKFLAYPVKSAEIHSYILTTNGSVYDKDIYLNNEKMTSAMLKNGKLDLTPKIRRARTNRSLTVDLPPKSIGYFVLPGVMFPVCITGEDEIDLIMEEITENQTSSVDKRESDESSDSSSDYEDYEERPWHININNNLNTGKSYEAIRKLIINHADRTMMHEKKMEFKHPIGRKESSLEFELQQLKDRLREKIAEKKLELDLDELEEIFEEVKGKKVINKRFLPVDLLKKFTERQEARKLAKRDSMEGETPLASKNPVKRFSQLHPLHVIHLQNQHLHNLHNHRVRRSFDDQPQAPKREKRQLRLSEINVKRLRDRRWKSPFNDKELVSNSESSEELMLDNIFTNWSAEKQTTTPAPELKKEIHMDLLVSDENADVSWRFKNEQYDYLETEEDHRENNVRGDKPKRHEHRRSDANEPRRQKHRHQRDNPPQDPLNQFNVKEIGSTMKKPSRGSRSSPKDYRHIPADYSESEYDEIPTNRHFPIEFFENLEGFHAQHPGRVPGSHALNGFDGELWEFDYSKHAKDMDLESASASKSMLSGEGLSKLSTVEDPAETEMKILLNKYMIPGLSRSASVASVASVSSDRSDKSMSDDYDKYKNYDDDLLPAGSEMRPVKTYRNLDLPETFQAPVTIKYEERKEKQKERKDSYREDDRRDINRESRKNRDYEPVEQKMRMEAPRPTFGYPHQENRIVKDVRESRGKEDNTMRSYFPGPSSNLYQSLDQMTGGEMSYKDMDRMLESRRGDRSERGDRGDRERSEKGERRRRNKRDVNTDFKKIEKLAKRMRPVRKIEEREKQLIEKRRAKILKLTTLLPILLEIERGNKEEVKATTVHEGLTTERMEEGTKEEVKEETNVIVKDKVLKEVNRLARKVDERKVLGKPKKIKVVKATTEEIMDDLVGSTISDITGTTAAVVMEKKDEEEEDYRIKPITMVEKNETKEKDGDIKEIVEEKETTTAMVTETTTAIPVKTTKSIRQMRKADDVKDGKKGAKKRKLFGGAVVPETGITKGEVTEVPAVELTEVPAPESIVALTEESTGAPIQTLKDESSVVEGEAEPEDGAGETVGTDEPTTKEVIPVETNDIVKGDPDTVEVDETINEETVEGRQNMTQETATSPVLVQETQETRDAGDAKETADEIEEKATTDSSTTSEGIVEETDNAVDGDDADEVVDIAYERAKRSSVEASEKKEKKAKKRSAKKAKIEQKRQANLDDLKLEPELTQTIDDEENDALVKVTNIERDRSISNSVSSGGVDSIDASFENRSQQSWQFVFGKPLDQMKPRKPNEKRILSFQNYLKARLQRRLQKNGKNLPGKEDEPKDEPEDALKNELLLYEELNNEEKENYRRFEEEYGTEAVRRKRFSKVFGGQNQESAKLTLAMQRLKRDNVAKTSLLERLKEKLHARPKRSVVEMDGNHLRLSRENEIEYEREDRLPETQRWAGGDKVFETTINVDSDQVNTIQKEKVETSEEKTQESSEEVIFINNRRSGGYAGESPARSSKNQLTTILGVIRGVLAKLREHLADAYENLF